VAVGVADRRSTGAGRSGRRQRTQSLDPGVADEALSRPRDQIRRLDVERFQMPEVDPRRRDPVAVTESEHHEIAARSAARTPTWKERSVWLMS
jgi:hypothetical protein